MDTQYFNQRRTIRKYSDKKIPAELLRTMLESAMRAPTTGNMQLYSAVVTTDEEVKHRLSPCHFNQPQVMSAAAVITFCADYNRFIKWCEASEAVPGYNNFQSFMTATLDAAIFAQQFNTIAELNGLGCCYLGTTTYNAEEIAAVLNLPEMVVPIITITVGYPDGEPAQVERHWRKYSPTCVTQKPTAKLFPGNSISLWNSKAINSQKNKDAATRHTLNFLLYYFIKKHIAAPRF